jgi:hypothetical protein
VDGEVKIKAETRECSRWCFGRELRPCLSIDWRLNCYTKFLSSRSSISIASQTSVLQTCLWYLP